LLYIYRERERERERERAAITMHFNSDVSALLTTRQISGTVDDVVLDGYIYAIDNGHR
jgi:hypothetical protein